MKELLKELLVTIEEFIFDIDETIGIQIGIDSQAFIDSNDIVIGIYSTLHRDNIIDIAHEDYYLTNNFHYKKYGIFYETFVILHEIGHLQTMPTRKEIIQYNKIIKKINKNKKLTDYEKLIEYFNTDLEYNADMWAYTYVVFYQKKVKEFNDKIHSIKLKILESLTE